MGDTERKCEQSTAESSSVSRCYEKAAFLTEDDAKTEIERVATLPKVHRPTIAYLCFGCRRWHVSRNADFIAEERKPVRKYDPTKDPGVKIGSRFNPVRIVTQRSAVSAGTEAPTSQSAAAAVSSGRAT